MGFERHENSFFKDFYCYLMAVLNTWNERNVNSFILIFYERIHEILHHSEWRRRNDYSCRTVKIAEPFYVPTFAIRFVSAISFSSLICKIRLGFLAYNRRFEKNFPLNLQGAIWFFHHPIACTFSHGRLNLVLFQRRSTFIFCIVRLSLSFAHANA